MMELTKVSEEIQHKISQLDSAKKAFIESAKERAERSAEYDKILAKTIIALKNGRTFHLDGEEIENPPVTILEKIAKGLCWEVKLEMDKAEAKHRSTLTAIEIIEAQLNGYQSINRHLRDL